LDLGLLLALSTGFELDGRDLKSRRTGTRCSGPSDLNRTAQIEGLHDLILSVNARSDGQRERGLRGRRFLAGDLPRGGASPEFANVGAPGVLDGRDRAGERGWTAGNSSKGLGRLIRARVGGLHDGGGSGGGHAGGARVPGVTGG
jgi:hypothetical protein